jgi:serine protease Do
MKRSVLVAAGVLITSGMVQAKPDRPIPSDLSVAALSAAFEQLARSTSKAVVQINVSGYAVTSESSSGQATSLTREKGLGSGVLLSEDGYIVTNAHVVHNALSIMVKLPSEDALAVQEDNATALPARVVGSDAETDIALLKVEGGGLPFLALGDSSQVRQGQLVVAFGSPLGFTNSMTMGMVSSPARQLSEDKLVQYIQTDAAINPGNSGGPLVDGAGNVIGMNTMILSQSGGNEGVGLAIPSNLIRNVVDQLKVRGHVHRGRIGANAQTVTPTLAEGLGLMAKQGALITDLLPDGPADEAGLRIGDVVVKLNGTPVRGSRELELGVFRAAGQMLHLDVISGGMAKSLDVSVSEREDDEPMLTLTNPKDNLIPELAIVALTIDKDRAAELPSLREQSGVIVAALAPEPTAWTTDLQPADVIHELNGSPVASVEFLRSRLAEMKPGSAVVLQVERDGVYRYLAFRSE